MANSSSLLNIASLLLNNLDITSIVKTMLNKIDMGQLTGMVSGALGTGNGNVTAASAPQSQEQTQTSAASAPPVNNTGSFLQGLNINSFAPPIQTLNTQAIPGMFSQMLGGFAPVQGYQMQQPFLSAMNQGLINPYQFYPYSNYYGGYYMTPQEDLE